MCYLYFFCLHCCLINIHIFDYPDSRLSGLFSEVPTSPDNRGSTVAVNVTRTSSSSDNYMCPLRSFIILTLTLICTKEASTYSTSDPLQYRIIINNKVCDVRSLLLISLHIQEDLKVLFSAYPFASVIIASLAT